jgi:hypothetical protein
MRKITMFFKMGILALISSVAVTGVGWLCLGKASPLTHGTSPDANSNPLVFAWVIMNLPAAIAFINIFGNLGPEWGYFLCVFIQWLVIAVLGALVYRAFRRSKNRPDSN